ncbi:2,3-bisphosphoglycerate-independent phosphoglycerate mutase [Serratia fonticola]|uniref:phosphoglycerate mutase (2,3-diphosphoglycerate-independent) n=1 Tax=Serratia fonticola TaxID=47917 RepID=A0A4U9TRR4_SERFO|nr:2,3-bisphosphoglycerate-independent phosphoglycerate mutase [Serratia fonticola]
MIIVGTGVQLAYDLMTQAKGEFTADNAVAALQAAYARGENDEFVKPTVIQAAGEASAEMNDGDALIFMNFRADRARQITAPSSMPISTASHVAKWSSLVILSC